MLKSNKIKPVFNHVDSKSKIRNNASLGTFYEDEVSELNSIDMMSTSLNSRNLNNNNKMPTIDTKKSQGSIQSAIKQLRKEGKEQMDELKVSRQLLLFLQEELLIISQKVDKRISPNFPDPSFISVGEIENNSFSSLNNKNKFEVNKNQVESWFTNEVKSINNNESDSSPIISITNTNTNSHADKISKYNSLIAESDAFKSLNDKIIELNLNSIQKYEELKEEMLSIATPLPSSIIEKSSNIKNQQLLTLKVTNDDTNNIEENSNNVIINKNLSQINENVDDNNDDHDNNNDNNNNNNIETKSDINDDNIIDNNFNSNQPINHDAALLINTQRRKANSKFENEFSSLNKGFDLIKFRMDNLEEDIRTFKRTILSEINGMKKLKRLNNGEISIIEINELEEKEQIILNLKKEINNQNEIIINIKSEELIKNEKIKKLESNVEDINNKNMLFESSIKLLQDQLNNFLNPINNNTIVNENNTTIVDKDSKEDLRNNKEKSEE
jgi:hypothetical protein